MDCANNIYHEVWNTALLWLRNWWIDIQVRFTKPRQSDYCLVGGPKAPINKLALFHWEEQFISPCTLNGINCGGRTAGWIPRIQFMSGLLPQE